MTFGETIPFDIKDVRTVFYDLQDPDRLELAQQDLRQKVIAIEQNPGDVRNPITVARNVTLLQQSDDPADHDAGAVLAALNDVRDDIRALAMRLPAAHEADGRAPVQALRSATESEPPVLMSELQQLWGLLHGRGGEGVTTEQIAGASRKFFARDGATSKVKLRQQRKRERTAL